MYAINVFHHSMHILLLLLAVRRNRFGFKNKEERYARLSLHHFAFMWLLSRVFRVVG